VSTDFLQNNTIESDHSLTLTITGEVESLRPRLIEAVQELGYTVLGEQPIYAKRGAQCGARWGCSLSAIDYPTKLTLTLKQINEIAVVAGFNYEIKSYMMTKGDRQTLAREAEAIAALASERFISACPSCGTQITDDSHFCRRCGAPLVVDVAELEVLRLTRKSRASYYNLVFAVVSLLVAVALVVPMFWVQPKLFRVLVMLSSLAGAFGFFALLQSFWQLHHTLKPKAKKETTARSQPTFAAAFTTALPAATARGSITEGTTELLTASLNREIHRTVEPVEAKVFDTGEVDDDRLM
jgi:hypothetical protein